MIANLICSKESCNMAQFDYHIHSCCSDGSFDLTTLQEKTKHLQQFSICDHDTFLAYDQIRDERLVYGVEISCHDHILSKDVHVLAYMPKSRIEIERFCEPTLLMNKKVCYEQVCRLQKAGYKIEWNRVLKKAEHSSSVYKQHIMACLIEDGIADAIYGNFYQKMFKNGGICQLSKTYPSVRNAINVIHRASGLAILAHPCLSKVDLYLDHYLDMGVDGLEVYHSSVSLQQAYALHDYCLRHDLLETGGSDCHGLYGNEPDIGAFVWEREKCVFNKLS